MSTFTFHLLELRFFVFYSPRIKTEKKDRVFGSVGSQGQVKVSCFMLCCSLSKPETTFGMALFAPIWHHATWFLQGRQVDSLLVPSALVLFGIFGFFLGFLPFSNFYRAYISCHYQKYKRVDLWRVSMRPKFILIWVWSTRLIWYVCRLWDMVFSWRFER